jgi:hypothetical protein
MATEIELRKDRIRKNPKMVYMIKQYLKRGQLHLVKSLGFTPEEVKEL